MKLVLEAYVHFLLTPKTEGADSQAWMYREDYARAGYLVLPQGQQSGRFMSWQALMASLALIPVSFSPVISGAGPVYFVCGPTELRVFLLQRPFGFSKIKRLGAPITDGFNYLSAAGIRPGGAG